MSTEYLSRTSGNSNKSSGNKKPRKIRCTEEFNHLDRTSIFLVPSNDKSTKKSKTKKRTYMQFLPQIQLNMEVPTNKENVMVNGNSPIEVKQKKIKRTRKHKVDIDLPQIEILADKSQKKKKCNSTSEQSEPSTESDNMDSEVVFKRKNKTRKAKKNKVETAEIVESILANNGEIQDNIEKLKTKEETSVPIRQSISSKKLGFSRQRNNEIANCEIPSGNVIVEEIVTLEDDQQLQHIEILSDQGRKSVRFISPSKRSVTNRISTFDLQNKTSDFSVLKSISSIEDSTRSENSFKTYRKSPHVKKLASRLHMNVELEVDGLSPDKADTNHRNVVWSSPSFSENNAVNNIAINENILKTKNEISECNSSADKTADKKENNFELAQTVNRTIRAGKVVGKSLKKDNERHTLEHNQSQNKTPATKTVSERRNTFEMPSPIFGPVKTDGIISRNDSSTGIHKKKSIINLITPEKDVIDSVIIIETGPKILVRESTFTRMERICEDQNGTIRTSSPVLDLNTTFSKKNTIAEKQSDYNLKKKKRRTWNKSLGVSFLDNSGNLQNITAPWTRELNDISVAKETPKGNRAMLIEKSGIIHSKVAKIPLSGTSTPLPADKKHSLRAALLKETHVKINENKNCTLAVQRPKKMPNFAMIHQRAYEKMENLQEMSERKASRAKLLLSGQKPTLETGCNRKSPNKTRKALLSPRMATSQTQTTPKLTSSKVTKVKALTPSTSNPKLLQKSLAQSKIPRPQKNTIAAEKKGFTRLGFKVGAEAVKNTTKEEQVRAFVSKSKVTTSSVDQRRTNMKNVRTNRRFELLMKMRNKNKV